MTDEYGNEVYCAAIEDGEQCPECGTDISVAGNGCSIETADRGRLAKLERKCYSCLHRWEVWNYVGGWLDDE